jgi:hypothetical protein
VVAGAIPDGRCAEASALRGDHAELGEARAPRSLTILHSSAICGSRAGTQGRCQLASALGALIFVRSVALFVVLEERMAEVERVNTRLEEAALTTARAMAEVSRRWDAVYDAMRRADRIDRQISSERDHAASRERRD